MFLVISICIILTSVATSMACPDVKPMSNFDFKSYAKGRWFESGRYDALPSEKGGDCGMCDYSGDDTDGSDQIRAVQCTDVSNKKLMTINWSVTPVSNAGDTAQLLYYSNSKDVANLTANILDTDYNNYAIFYNCIINDSNVPLELAWVKSRTPVMKPEIRAKVDKFLAEHPSIDESRMVWDHFTHEDCFVNDNKDKS